MPAADDHEAWSRLFGQIAIYTLLEDCVDAFDELTEAVVERVRAREPGTLVYIVHAVPSAPMQRILYEVYRDREACEAHKRQPYIAKFELDRRPYVLATNVIELGLQRAKLSASSSLDELLSESGVMPAVGPAKAGPAGGGAPGAAGPPLSANGHANGSPPRNAGGAAPGLGRGPQRRR
jgi:quinol monooxygenase YgiN